GCAFLSWQNSVIYQIHLVYKGCIDKSQYQKQKQSLINYLWTNCKKLLIMCLV
ncbi:MAG: hypothetical protein EBY20_04845, partial [Alphaproteobacteria bacterium]|nr:hypothetical protein [Alphaproteobacteria bacterium]